MNDLALALSRLKREDPSPAPRFFELADPEHRRQLGALVAQGQVFRAEDLVPSQLAELMQARQPRAKLTDEQAATLAREHLAGRPADEYGVWVYFPWSGQLTHLLPRDEFQELRFNRNAYKITPREQEQLSRRVVGVVGLSVGFSVAMSLAMEGVGRCFRLADFDRMALSNLNRVPCGVAAIGRNKAIAAAQRLFELDPFLEVEVFASGLHPENVEQFLAQGRKLDVLVEECDDLWLKAFVRESARRLGIPVVMDTNDRGMIDVERFDREPARPILHGLVGDTPSQRLRGLVGRQKVPFVLGILDDTKISAALAASLFEIDETVVGWPQLGSGTLLGAAAVTDVVRRVLLDRLTTSGRWYVDLGVLVSEQSASLARPRDVPPTPVFESGVRTTSPIGRLSRLDREAAERAVGQAILAPSGGNRQPWRFHLTSDRRILCALDAERARSFLDYRFGAAHLACGAALENLVLALAAGGNSVTTTIVASDSQPGAVAIVELTPDHDEDPKLAAFIAARSTNRRLTARRLLPEEVRAALRRIAHQGGCQLQILEDEPSLGRAGHLLGEVDRFRFFCPALHRELVEEIRWDPASASRTRDGIDLQTLEIDEVDAAGLRLLSRSDVVSLLRDSGLGTALGRASHKAMAASSALILLSIEGDGADAFVRGGRTMQRLWLEATRLGVALQPMSVAPYLCRRLEHGRGEGFSDAEIRWLAEIRESYVSLLPRRAGQLDLLLFRLGFAPPPSAISLRRDVAEVFTADP